MKRNEFLKVCGVGLCGCAVSSLLAEAETRPESGDGQSTGVSDEVAQLKSALDGAHERFARLLAVMGEELDEADRNRILRRLGGQCARTNAKFFEAYRGNLAGFIARAKTAWLEDSEYDEKAGLLRVVGKPSPCYCPLVKKGLTPASFCTCTLGWQEAAYSIILGKPVTAEIEETVLGGGPRCSFRLRF